jgi:malonate decarboxylase gamma subunit
VEGLDELGDRVLPMSYKMSSYAKLGLLHELIEGINADTPGREDVERVKASLIAAVEDARQGPNDLSSRLQSADAKRNRAASIEVRKRMAEQWDAS